MKRTLLILTAFILCFSLCACGDKVEPLNEAVGYTFTVPEEWELIRNDGTIELRYDLIESDQMAEYATITALTFTLGSEQADFGAKNYWEFYKKDVEKLGEYKELDFEEFELNGTPALKVKYSYKPLEKVYISEQIICCRLGEVFIITLTSPEAKNEDVTDDFKTVRDSFQFTK